MLPQKILDFRVSVMVSDAFLNKKSLPMPNQNNVEHFLKILLIASETFQDNFQNIPWRARVFLPHISLSLVRLAQPRDGAAGVITPTSPSYNTEIKL